MAVDPQASLLLYRDAELAHARITCPINRETAPILERELAAALPDDCRFLTLDLGSADYLDSDGIRWLQRLQAALAARHTELRLAVREGSRVDRTLRLLQLQATLPAHRYTADVDTADEDARGAAPAAASTR